MIIIKEGTLQKGWAKEFECTGKGNNSGGCGAILLVEVDDLFETSSSSMGESSYFTTFQCKQCGVLTDIKGSDVPYFDRLGNHLVLPKQNVWRENHKNWIV